MAIRSKTTYLPQVASCSHCEEQQPAVQRCLPKPTLASDPVQIGILQAEGIQRHPLFPTGKRFKI